jgi:hypothetical protein
MRATYMPLRNLVYLQEYDLQHSLIWDDKRTESRSTGRSPQMYSLKNAHRYRSANTTLNLVEQAERDADRGIGKLRHRVHGIRPQRSQACGADLVRRVARH